MVDALIDRLIIYPIKVSFHDSELPDGKLTRTRYAQSCRGIELTQSRYTPDGLEVRPCKERQSILL